MTPQERDLITTLLARLKSTAATAQAKDPEADAVIRQAMREQPDAPYFLVQTVLIQDLSLLEAQNRIADLEQQLAEAQKPSSGSFLGGLFAPREAQPPAPVQHPGPWSRGPQVAPREPPSGPGGYGRPGPDQQPGYAQQQPYAPGGMMGGGGGFLRSAAATAAGVAGGALLFHGISSLFGSGYANSLYSGGGANPGLGESVAGNSGGDYGGGDAGYTGGGPDYGGDYGGGEYDAGDDFGGDFGGGDDI